MEKFEKVKLLFCSIFLFSLIIFPIFGESSSTIQIKHILLGVLFSFIILFLILIIYAINIFIKDKILIKSQIKSLKTKNYNFSENHKQKNTKVKISLISKMLVITIGLVIIIISSISSSLAIIIFNNQKETLATGLQRRITVLMESISRGAKVYLPEQNTLELNLLTEQSNTMLEAKSITILGFPADKNKERTINYVWASNDPNINTKIDTKEIVFGQSRIINPELLEITSETLKLNNNVTYNIKKTSNQITELISEYKNYEATNTIDNEEKKQDLFILIKELNTKVEMELHQIAKKNLGSIPPFNNKTIERKNTDYLFYQPILFKEPTEENFVKGLVLIEVNTDSLIDSLDITRNKILISILIVSVIVIFIGAIISLVLSVYIVKPIKQLQKHVAMIKDTENKAELYNKKIFINTKDEIEILSSNINEMTENLVQAAVYESMLLGGKEVQRSFLPLDTVDNVNKIKLSVGHIETSKVQFFGYYEGAKGVSGDFFDFKNLDGRYFALIKCDVSGKGTPAALIMAEVSALFCDYFRNWTYEENDINLQKLIYKINDQLESRNLQGKFAAFTLGIFDTELGDIYFCNAGDNIIHIYDYSEKQQKTITLPSTPAAGIFSSSIIKEKGGFPTTKVHLDKNDILFLYTDGIEDSKRFFRNSENEILRFIPNSNKIHEDKSDNNIINSEEFGKERIKKIIDSVFSREKYELIKKQNPIENEDQKLIFDFSMLEGSPEDVIMALVSVEKIFRLYQTSSENNHAIVDKKIDKFLELHFNKYDTICNAKLEHPNPDLKDEYIVYTSMKEEEQTDDLTLVAIKKK